MKKVGFKTYAIWILITEAVGALSGFITRDGTKLYGETINKPVLSPPAVLFPIVWTVLYALMGIGAARIYISCRSKDRSAALRIYSGQLLFNFFWSIFFFNLQAFWFSFVWLILLLILVVLMIISFKKIDKTAAYLQIPYLIWVIFAGYLNLGAAILN